ncbi:hypothetical protein [Salibacterium aidingense]|nr:hypothetical protein [Salibacterium aidingense]
MNRLIPEHSLLHGNRTILLLGVPLTVGEQITTMCIKENMAVGVFKGV